MWPLQSVCNRALGVPQKGRCRGSHSIAPHTARRTTTQARWCRAGRVKSCADACRASVIRWLFVKCGGLKFIDFRIGAVPEECRGRNLELSWLIPSACIRCEPQRWCDTKTWKECQVRLFLRTNAALNMIF